MRNIAVVMAVLVAVFCIAGCEVWEQVRASEPGEFAQWLDANRDGATGFAIEGREFSILQPDGSRLTRELPGAASVDGPVQYVTQATVDAILASVQSGSPAPLINIPIAGLLALAGAVIPGLIAKKKNDALNVREKQLEIVTGEIRAAPPEASKAIVENVEKAARQNLVENGPLGLNAFVKAKNTAVK